MFKFSITKRLHKCLYDHLFAGDGKEGAAIILCARGSGRHYERIIANQLVPVAIEDSSRSESHISWPFSKYLSPKKIDSIERMCQSIILVHSHPNGLDLFSSLDDKNDCEIFPSINSWFDDRRPHGSAIMIPGGRMLVRIVSAEAKFRIMKTVSVVGDCVTMWQYNDDGTFIR